MRLSPIAAGVYVHLALAWLPPGAHAQDASGLVEYRVLATSRTSTMQRELQEAGDAGYRYRGQTVFKTLFSGEEVVVILERDGSVEKVPFEYRLLATSRTSTLQKELTQAGKQGFDFVGLTVGETAVGGREVVAILRRERAER